MPAWRGLSREQSLDVSATRGLSPERSNDFAPFQPRERHVFAPLVARPPLGFITETETVYPLSIAKRVTLGLITELDSPILLTRKKLLGLGFITELDTALPLAAPLQPPPSSSCSITETVSPGPSVQVSYIISNGSPASISLYRKGPDEFDFVLDQIIVTPATTGFFTLTFREGPGPYEVYTRVPGEAAPAVADDRVVVTGQILHPRTLHSYYRRSRGS